MSDLDEFKSKNKPSGKVSKIEPYKSDIFDLKSNGYSTPDVVRYLAEYKNTVVSVQAVNNFLKKQKEHSKNLNKKTKSIKKANRSAFRQPEKLEKPEKKEHSPQKTFVIDRIPLSELIK